MRIEKVTFVDSAVRGMKKKDFIDAHMNIYWLDRSEEDRRKMLSDVYDTIKSEKKEQEKE
jgi:hypothetical protein